MHSQFRELLAELAAENLPRLDELSPAEARQLALRKLRASRPGPAMDCIDVEVPGGAGGIPARWYRPGLGPGMLVWLHGGGWVLGGLDSHDGLCRRLAVSVGVDVLAVDYRLAPEHPFPAGLEDCWTALCWIAAQIPGPLLIGGDSSGGNLAAVCAVRAREAGRPQLAAQLLVYPVTDHRMDTDSYRDHGDEGTFLGRREMEWFWDHYVADPTLRANPEVSPLRVKDLSGLPPTVLVTAGYDPLLDEGHAFGARLREAGVSVDEHLHADLVHGFCELVGQLSCCDEAVVSAAEALRRSALHAKARCNSAQSARCRHGIFTEDYSQPEPL